MKNLTLILTLFLSLLALPAVAMQHDQSSHGSHSGANGMAAAGALADLGTQTVNGVAAMAHIKDVRDVMAKSGQATTHHFMVMFNDAQSGKSIDGGKVAVKITAPGGTVGAPLELMGMPGHFGADLVLSAPGSYRFEVGTRLADGKIRQFVFSATIK